jgi:hypothetical protein
MIVQCKVTIDGVFYFFKTTIDVLKYKHDMKSTEALFVEHDIFY